MFMWFFIAWAAGFVIGLVFDNIIVSNDFQQLIDCAGRCMESERKNGSTLPETELFYKCLRECSTRAKLSPFTRLMWTRILARPQPAR